MAEKRMFAKTIIDSDAFLDMPQSTQNLYFHLSMRADDDGFVNNPKKIIRVVNSSNDDLKLLISKRFLIGFESGIVVIKHWKIHNYIAKDRYRETKYKELLSTLYLDENNSYTLSTGAIVVNEKAKKPLSEARLKRLEARNESSLPSSFDYKIKSVFVGEECPVCHIKMGQDEFAGSKFMPSIQHNKAISKGGKHEIDNISVICLSCNESIQANETGELNNKIVKEKWAELCGVSGMYTQSSLGKVSLVKSSVEENVKPKKHKYGEYKHILLTDEEYQKLETKGLLDWITKVDEGIELKGYKYKSHYLAVLKWQRDEKKPEKKPLQNNTFHAILPDNPGIKDLIKRESEKRRVK